MRRHSLIIGRWILFLFFSFAQALAVDEEKKPTRSPETFQSFFDGMLNGLEAINSQFIFKLYSTRDLMDSLHTTENKIDPALYKTSYQPFLAGNPVYSFTADYRVRPIKRVNLLVLIDSKLETTGSFFTYFNNLQGYFDAQVEVNTDIGDFLNLSARVTFRNEKYSLLYADVDTVGTALRSNVNADMAIQAKGSYLYTKEKIAIKLTPLKTLLIQPTFSLSLEMNEFTYGGVGSPGSLNLDPYLVNGTGANRISKKYSPTFDADVFFRPFNGILVFDVGGYYHPQNLSISTYGSPQSFLQWSAFCDASWRLNKHLSLLGSVRVTRDEYSYTPVYQTSFFNASEGDLSAQNKAAEYND